MEQSLKQWELKMTTLVDSYIKEENFTKSLAEKPQMNAFNIV